MLMAVRPKCVATAFAAWPATWPTPTVMVTHHVDEVPVGATHALVMSDGRSVASGSCVLILVL